LQITRYVAPGGRVSILKKKTQDSEMRQAQRCGKLNIPSLQWQERAQSSQRHFDIGHSCFIQGREIRVAL
jgi:hypothetical protein